MNPGLSRIIACMLELKQLVDIQKINLQLFDGRSIYSWFSSSVRICCFLFVLCDTSNNQKIKKNRQLQPHNPLVKKKDLFLIVIPPSYIFFLWQEVGTARGLAVVMTSTCVNRSLLNLASLGSEFYISTSSVGKPSTCIPIWADRTEKEHMVCLLL